MCRTADNPSIRILFSKIYITAQFLTVQQYNDNRLYIYSYNMYIMLEKYILLFIGLKYNHSDYTIVLHGNTPPESNVCKIYIYFIEKNSISQPNGFRHVYSPIYM